jgi:ABC-type nitrate/sulfonate/bicarbonate transport system ATPase subunit
MAPINKSAPPVVAGVENLCVNLRLQRGVQRPLLSNFSLVLRRGERVALLGPNGSGKTTILRVLLGQQRPDRGTIVLQVRKNQIGYMPQDFRKALFPWLSIQQNVDLYRSADDGFPEPFFREAFSSFSLPLKLQTPVSQLSGGEQQLLLLCLGAARGSSLLVLDEPFSAVDVTRRSTARRLVASRIADCESALLLVTHDVSDAATLTTHAVVLTGSPKECPKVVLKDTSGDFREELLVALGS